MSVQSKGSKRTRTKEPAPSGIQFLTFSHPQDWSSKENRLAVRSHVTRRQHQLSRGEITIPLQEDVPKAVQDYAGARGDSSSEVLRLATTGHRKRKSVATLDDVRGHEKRRSLHLDPALFGPADDQNVFISQGEVPSCVPPPWTSSGEQSAYSSRANSISVNYDHPSTASSTSEDSSAGHAVGSQECAFFALPPDILSDIAAREILFTSMEEYMTRSFAPMGFPALLLTPEAGRIWMDTMRHESNLEPSLRLARLLFAAGHLCQINLLRPEIKNWLHEQAIAEVTTALNSNKRKLSEGLILAIGRLAFYESMFGDKAFAHEVHRPAQARMIAERGGLDGLQLPEAVKYLMRWADIIMSLQSGSTCMLNGSTEDATLQPVGVEHSLRALAVWLPEQYAALCVERPIVDFGGLSRSDTVEHIDPRLS